MSDVDKGPVFLIVSVAMYSVTLLVFGARLMWRWRSQNKGWDDFMLAAALIMLTLHTTFGLVAYHYGFGKSKTILTPENTRLALKYFFILQNTYKPLGGFVKMAFLCLYLRVFQIPKFQLLTKIMMANVVLGTVALTLATTFQCTPIQRAWNKTVPGTCISLMAFWYAHSVWHAAGDFIIFLMPVPVIRTLQIPGSRKWGLISVFALGAFTCAASIMRMTTLAGSSRSNDPTYGSHDAVLWTEIESNTSIICACLPGLRAPIVQLWRRVCGKSAQSQTTHRLTYVKSKSISNNPRSTTQSHVSHNWTAPKPAQRSWYDSAFTAIEQPVGTYFNSSQERIVGIMKTTDVEVSGHSSAEEVEKRSIGSDVTEVDLGRPPPMSRLPQRL